MGMLNVNVRVKGSELGIDRKKVEKLCSRFFKQCDKLEATPFEVAVAIGLMQEHVLAEYKCLPLTEKVVEYVREITEIEESMEA